MDHYFPQKNSAFNLHISIIFLNKLNLNLFKFLYTLF